MIWAVALNTSLDRNYQIPDFALGGRYRVASVEASAGGKGVNVARIARQLGAPVQLTGFIAGHAGSTVEALARADGLSPRFLRVGGETRLSLAIAHSEGRVTEILEPGPHVSPADMERLRAMLTQSLAPGDLVCLSGSLPPGLPETTYAEWIPHITARRAYAMVDTSGPPLAHALAARPFAVKPNREEFEAWLGRRASLTEIPRLALDVHRSGIPWVMISLGADGMVVAAEDTAWRVRIPQVPAVSPVGCGDALVGGWAAYLSTHFDTPPVRMVPEAVRLAMGAALSNVMRLDSGRIDPGEVPALAAQVSIERLTSLGR